MVYYDMKGRGIEPGARIRHVGGEELLVVTGPGGELGAQSSDAGYRPLSLFVTGPAVLGKPVLWEWEVQ